MNSIEEDIMILETECYYLEELGYLRENNHFIRFNQALKNLIKGYKELEEEKKDLKDKLNSSRKANEKLSEKNRNLQIEKETAYSEAINNIIAGVDLDNSFIPVSLVEEKIEELNKLLEEDLQDERKINSNRFIIICQCKSCLQELLEKRK